VVELLGQAVPVSALVVAVDPGKVSSRVWVTSGERGLIGEPVSLPMLREGIDTLAGLIGASGVAGPPIIGVEATGGLHRAWVAELERRWPGSVRLFAPSETQAARAQLGSRRYKTDDRDCAALVWLLRQGAGRPVAQGTVDALVGRSVTGAGWSPTARSSSSACMTSSRRCAPACRPRPAMAAPWRWTTRPGRPCWRVRPPLPAGHRRSGRWWPARPAGSPRPPPSSGWTDGGGCCPTRRR
jgi:hypothetical protein